MPKLRAQSYKLFELIQIGSAEIEYYYSERSNKFPFDVGRFRGVGNMYLFTQKEKAFDLLFCVNPPGLQAYSVVRG